MKNLRILFITLFVAIISFLIISSHSVLQAQIITDTIRESNNHKAGSIAISWETETKSDGKVYYSLNQDMTGKNVAYDESNNTYVHYVEIKDLEIGKTYYYYVQSGDSIDDNGYSFTTFKPGIPRIPKNYIIINEIVTDYGAPAPDDTVITVRAKLAPGGIEIAVSYYLSSRINNQGTPAFKYSLEDLYKTLELGGGEYVLFPSIDNIYIDVFGGKEGGNASTMIIFQQGDNIIDSITLTGGEEPAADSDGDGIADSLDGCPNDASKTTAGACGCGVADTDSDSDGTPDCIDSCPNDASKIDPGDCGCGVADTDSDNDGTPDCNDQCPNDSLKTAPGVCGCGVADTDSDNDGTPDCNDQCPNDSLKTESGVCGCGVADIDSDSDGTLDCNDQCPNDPLKTAPGACGCGVADTDSNNNGTPDCNEVADNCPDDPLKTEPGVCGCGVADVDSDSDGVLDCNDGCPNNALKTAPGVCGCSVADVDSDSDGVLDCQDGCPNDPQKTAPGVCGCGVVDAAEVFDGKDNDCNGLIDDTCYFEAFIDIDVVETGGTTNKTLTIGLDASPLNSNAESNECIVIVDNGIGLNENVKAAGSVASYIWNFTICSSNNGDFTIAWNANDLSTCGYFQLLQVSSVNNLKTFAIAFTKVKPTSQTNVLVADMRTKSTYSGTFAVVTPPTPTTWNWPSFKAMAWPQTTSSTWGDSSLYNNNNWTFNNSALINPLNYNAFTNSRLFDRIW